MNFELIDNSFQIIILGFCTIAALFLALRYKSRSLLILALAYACFCMGTTYYILYLVIMGKVPQVFYVAAFMAVRLTYLILGSSVLTLTTTPNNLTDGLEKALSPLKVIKVPVHEISMMMSIALRFIPILLDETDKIMKAQMARCADFESGGLIKKAKSLVPLLVPLFISAFRRANDLAMAMEARGYRGGEGRTKMKPLIYKKRDHVAYVILLTYLVCIITTGNIIAF